MSKHPRPTAAALLTAAIAAAIGVPAAAQNLITNGDFEIAPPDFPGWELSESVTGLPGQFINSAEARDFANNPGGTDGEFGIWLRAFAGNTEQGLTNAAINADLTQTVPGTPGETYTFRGEALFEGNYAGGAEILDPTSPSGEIPTPTTNTFELTFLDGDTILDTFTRDVSEDVFNGFGYAAVTPITAVAPAGTTDVRVSARGENMVFNTDPAQTAFYDNFSLTAGSSPSTELLTNGDLNAFDPNALPGITFIESPEGNNTLATAGFANDTPDGALGAWVRAFAEGDATIQADVVPAAEGDEFLFGAVALFEANYSGGDPLSGTETLLELAFLDGTDPETASVLSTETFDVASVVSNGNGFTPVSLSGTAPAGTAGVQASVVVTGLVNTEGNQSAFFDDLTLTLANATLAGDYDDNGVVDAADYTAWRDSFGQPAGTLPNDVDGGQIGQAQFDTWAANFGSGTVASAIPEPTGAAIAAWLAAAAAARPRRGAA